MAPPPAPGIGPAIACRPPAARAATVTAIALGLAAVATVAAPAPAAAQIVNVQGLIGDDVPERLSGSVEGSVDLRAGNVDLVRLWGAATVRWRRGDHLVFGVVRGDHGESRDTVLISKVFEHVRYRWAATPRVSPEAFVQHEADRFRRLRVRALAGAGPRVTVATRPRWSAAVGVAYLLEYEQLTRDGLDEAGERSLRHRLSSYAVARLAIDERVTASETIYVQPRLDAPRDVRLLSEAAVGVKIGTRVTLKTALIVAHDADPPPETERTDVTLQSSVSVSF